MNNQDTYTPRNNGIAGLEEFGGIEHADDCARVGGPLYRGGKQVVGRCYEPTLVAEYLAKGGRITKCPTKWATNALRFSAGWDQKLVIANAQSAAYVDSVGNHHQHVGYCGRDPGSAGDE